MRAQYVFRTYDADNDGNLRPAELATLLAHIRIAYAQPPLALAEADEEACMLHAALVAEGGVLCLRVFREAVGQLRVRGCSRLFRSDFPLWCVRVRGRLRLGSG